MPETQPAIAGEPANLGDVTLDLALTSPRLAASDAATPGEVTGSAGEEPVMSGPKPIAVVPQPSNRRALTDNGWILTDQGWADSMWVEVAWPEEQVAAPVSLAR